MADSLTHAELLRRLEYDPLTGVFTWREVNKMAPKSNVVGGVAGAEDGLGYRRVSIDGKKYKAHRVAWFYMTGAWPGDFIDHIDGDRGNDRFANLREATRSINAQNQRQPHSNSTTGYLGVHWHKANKKFQARVALNGQRHSAGWFDDAPSAHAAYLALKARLHQGFVSG